MRSGRVARGGLGGGLFLVAAALAPAAPTAPPQAPADVEASRAAQAKIKAATEILAMCREFLVAPPGQRGTPAPVEVAEQIQLWSRNLTDARLEAAADRAERLQILAEALDRAKGYENEIRDLATNEESGLTKLTAAKASYYRADAEARLLREKASGR